MTTLVSEDVAQVFTIPDADWHAINRQAKAVSEVPDAAAPDGSDPFAALTFSAVLGQVPAFPPVRRLFVQWRSSTYPAILEHAAQVNRYAVESIASFSGPRPDVARLQQSTAAIAAQFAPVAQQIDALRLAEATLEGYFADHPDIEEVWRTIAPRIALASGIAGRIGHVEGTWRALADDLAARDAVTVPLLVELEIETAIAAWTRIGTEAASFTARMSPGA